MAVDMVDTKPAVKSTGILGSLTTIIAGGIGIALAHAHIPPELISNVQTPLAIAIAGGLFSLLGRWKATKAISGLFSSPS